MAPIVMAMNVSGAVYEKEFILGFWDLHTENFYRNFGQSLSGT